MLITDGSKSENGTSFAVTTIFEEKKLHPCSSESVGILKAIEFINKKINPSMVMVWQLLLRDELLSKSLKKNEIIKMWR